MDNQKTAKHDDETIEYIKHAKERENTQIRGAYGMIASSLLAPVLFLFGPLVLLLAVIWIIKKLFKLS